MLRLSACLLATFLWMALAACQIPPPIDEEQNAFAVMVDATRLGILIDHAEEGALSLDQPEEVSKSDMERADEELKNAAARLIVLRNDVCQRGLVPRSECALGPMPAWTLAPPSGGASLAELSRRTKWLSARMERYVDAGCKAGVKTSREELYCSVE